MCITCRYEPSLERIAFKKPRKRNSESESESESDSVIKREREREKSETFGEITKMWVRRSVNISIKV